jgi:DNA-binding response OmpR family regulator
MARRILLVDDDSSVLLTLKAVLELNGFEVETAGSAEEACIRLKASVFEIVITDVRMETESSGLEVIRAAHSQRYRPATAVLTAFPPRDERWRSQGVGSILVKPIRTRDLVGQLEALLQRQQGTSPPKP